ALEICLARYTGSDKVVIGSPARRKDGATVINALAIAGELDDQMSFRDFLLKTRETLIEAYARQSYPFDRLIQDLNLSKEENRCVLFDVNLRLRELHWEMPDVHSGMSVTFSMPEKRNSGELEGELEYDPSLFRVETMERFASHFMTVLGKGLADLDSP